MKTMHFQNNLDEVKNSNSISEEDKRIWFESVRKQIANSLDSNQKVCALKKGADLMGARSVKAPSAPSRRE